MLYLRRRALEADELAHFLHEHDLVRRLILVVGGPEFHIVHRELPGTVNFDHTPTPTIDQYWYLITIGTGI
jgi:hypothetical protein